MVVFGYFSSKISFVVSVIIALNSLINASAQSSSVSTGRSGENKLGGAGHKTPCPRRLGLAFRKGEKKGKKETWA